MSSPQANILLMPVEIIHIICDVLPNAAIKSFRLTCRHLSNSARPKLPRVLVSPNSQDLEVFKAIAHDEKYRGQVTEIVWIDSLVLEHNYDPESPDQINDITDESGYPGECPRWFRTICRYNLARLRQMDFPGDGVVDERACGLKEMEITWSLYQDILEDQLQIKHSREQANIFNKLITQFPSLRRITISPLAGDPVLYESYQTPMIRSLPPNFIHDVSLRWKSLRSHNIFCEIWLNSPPEDQLGVGIVLRALAEGKDKGKVNELEINGHRFDTGLNWRVFKDPSRILDDFSAVLARPGFKALSLDILVDDVLLSPQAPSHLFRSHLSNANGGAGLESLSLRFCTGNQLRTDSFCSDRKYDYCHDELNIGELLPSGKGYSRLEDVKILGVNVTECELVEFLRRLPGTLKSLELRCIWIEDSSWGEFLPLVRDKLCWEALHPNQPRFNFGYVDCEIYQRIRDTFSLDNFLYNGGPNPLEGGEHFEDQTNEYFTFATGLGEYF